MKTIALLAALMLASIVAASAQEKDTRLFEMRTYYAAPGKLDELNQRFREHTTALFAKHGMTNIGYWMPVENPDAKLVYVLAYPSREARDTSWKAFLADPGWQKAQAASEVKGKLVAKVEQHQHGPLLAAAPSCGPTPPRRASFRRCTRVSASTRSAFSPSTG